MKLFYKLWVRILVSLLAGGVAAEIIHLLTAKDINDRSNDHSSPLVMIFAIVTFFVLTYFVNRDKHNFK